MLRYRTIGLKVDRTVAVSHQGCLAQLLMEVVMQARAMLGERWCKKNDPFGGWEHAKMTECDREWMARLGKCPHQRNDRFRRNGGKSSETDVRPKPELL